MGVRNKIPSNSYQIDKGDIMSTLTKNDRLDVIEKLKGFDQLKDTFSFEEVKGALRAKEVQKIAHKKHNERKKLIMKLAIEKGLDKLI